MRVADPLYGSPVACADLVFPGTMGIVNRGNPDSLINRKVLIIGGGAIYHYGPDGVAGVTCGIF